MTSWHRFRMVGAVVLLSAGSAVPAWPQKLLADGVKDLATQIATSVTKERKQKIAVLPFRELDGQPTVLSTYIAEELVTNLFVIGGLDIVERAMLDRLLGELRLGQTGVIDPETAKQVGKVAGVDAIVTGSITDLQSYVAINCRLIDAQTGGIFAAAQTKIVKDDDVRKIMGAALPPAAAEVGRAAAPQPGSPAGQKAPSSANAVQQQQADGFAFDLKGCSLSGTSVECELLITNKGEDRALAAVASASRLFDDQGNEYRARSVSIGGGRSGRGVSVGSRLGGFEERTVLASGIPARTRLLFEGVPSDTERATLLEIVTRGPKVQFRDVPLVRP